MEVKGREKFKKGLVKGVPCKIPKMEKIFQTIISLRETASKGPEGLFYAPKEWVVR